MRVYNKGLQIAQINLVEFMQELSHKYFGSTWEQGLEYILWQWTTGDVKDFPNFENKLTELEIYRLEELKTLANGWACAPMEGSVSEVEGIYGEFVPFLTLTAELEDTTCTSCQGKTTVAYRSAMVHMRHCFRCNHAQMVFAMPMRYVQITVDLPAQPEK